MSTPTPNPRHARKFTVEMPGHTFTTYIPSAAVDEIRAEVAEEIAGMLGTFAANRREQNPKDLVAAAYLAAARHVREYAVDPAVRPVEPSAVPAEGSGQGPESCPSCGATVWPAGTPWTDSYRRLVLGKFPEGSGQRCPSRIAHESGVVLGCMHRVGHRGTHLTRDVQWGDGDDRLLAEGSGHPQPAPGVLVRREAPCFDCGQAENDHVDGRCGRYRPGDPGICLGGFLPAEPGDTELPVLSLDTPEGATDA